VALRRVGSGSFDVADASTLDEIAARVAERTFALGRPRDLVGDLESAVLSDDAVTDVRHGRAVVIDATGELVAAIDPSGELVAVLARRDDRYRPRVVLAGTSSDPR
jgi:tRNA pseudouridine55 synthase